MTTHDIITYLVHHPYCTDQHILGYIDDVITTMQRIVPLGLDDHRSIWIHYHDPFDQSNAWCELVLTTSANGSTIYLNGETIYRSYIHGEIPEQYRDGIITFYKVLKDGLNHAIQRIEDGLYQQDIETNLPLDQRYGIIRAKDLYKIMPRSWDHFIDQLEPGMLHHFLTLCANQDARSYQSLGQYDQTMDADRFYAICKIAYRALGFACAMVEPQVMVDQHGGDDHGLSLLDDHDQAAFMNWTKTISSGNGFFLMRGDAYSAIILNPHHDQNGWSIYLGSQSRGRTIDLLKIYIALRDQGIAVYLDHLEMVRNRLLQLDWIGIVPKTDFPLLAQDHFPLHRLYDFIQLPQEKTLRRSLLPYIQWMPLLPCYVMEN